MKGFAQYAEFIGTEYTEYQIDLLFKISIVTFTLGCLFVGEGVLSLLDNWWNKDKEGVGDDG